MGIFDALTTAVSGLSAQSYALQNISGNIANSQTTAFKRINTQFEDLMGDNLPSQQIAGGVLASSVATNNVQGDVQNASTSTFMAINGNGYFIIQKPTSFSGNQPVFGGVDLYTRRGDFQLDQNGFLVNGAGYYLEGIPVDPTTGNPIGSIPQTLQFSNNLIPAQQTSQIQYNANLPSQPVTTDTQSGVPGSNLLNPATFSANPLVGALQAAKIQGSGAAVPPTKVTGTAITFPLASNGTLVLTGTGTSTINVTAGMTSAQLLTAINTATPTTGISATVNGSNDLVLTSQDAATPLNIGAGSTALAELGLTSGNNGPTDLIAAGVVSAGQTLQVTIGSNPVQTITFGAGLSTLAQLDAALKGLTGVNAATTGVDQNGNITIVAGNTTDIVSVTGGPPASPTNIAAFGITNAQGFPSNGNVYGIDQTNFLNESVAGGSITAYDGTGTPVNMQFRWAKVDSASLGAGHTDKWNMFYQVNSNATNTQPAWTNVGVNFTFNSTGQLTPPLSTLSLTNVTVNGQSLGTVALVFGSGGLTQFSNTNGTVQVNLLNQNGASAGQLQSIAVDDQGRIVGTYSNGRTVPLAEVTLANFNGQNNLKQLDG
ncbi:MAG TPA: flagellar hook-basal body complex protein, partial [Xanthobacteraceae bacterium]|nr:flagellar hook-basal body complex protein [Xanthobacteraceae bacterium]